jgi:hypothetical protein
MAVSERELERLESLWDPDARQAFEVHLESARSEQVALAAALIELALRLQRLGGSPPPPGDLLRADLCLARASRLLAETRSRSLQVAFARAIEEQAAAAAEGRPAAPLRSALLAAGREGS